jgi:hypothetical protein
VGQFQIAVDMIAPIATLLQALCDASEKLPWHQRATATRDFAVRQRLARSATERVTSKVDPVLRPRSSLAYDDVAVEVAHDRADKYTPTHNPAPTTYSSQVAGMAYG